MYNIEIGETRSNVEEYLGRIYDLVLKQEKVLTGGARCFYGDTDDSQGYLEVIYAGDMVIDSKIHEDIVKKLAKEQMKKHIADITEAGNDREEVESSLDMLFYEAVGPDLKSNEVKTQKYGEKKSNKAYVKVQISYDEMDQVVKAEIIEEVIDLS